MLRKTAQHVDRWHRVVQATALAIAPDLAQRPRDEQQALQALAAAKLMGRTAEGAPVGEPTLGPVNRFNYDADAKGMGCPFAAHARRTNPRGRNEHGQRPVPRLLRRGMSYGLRWTEGEPADTERGLFFMAYCGSIAEQFEVVQRWVAGGNSSGVASSHGDPLLAVPQAGQPRWFQWLHDDNQVRRVSLGDEALTTLRWGLYLFVPAMAGLRHIARGPAVAPAPTPQPLAGALYAPGTPAFEDWRQLLQDSALRDTENVPLSETVEAYFKREVLPHAPDAWIDHEKTKVGYEIPFSRQFYVFEPPRELAEIDTDLKKVTDRIKAMIEGLSA